MRIAICDDEPVCIQMLTDLLCQLLPDADIRSFSDGETLLSDMDSYDVVFLDVSMPGIDGFETAERLRLLNNRQILVFVTAMEDQIRRGYEFDAADYIVKPATQEHLEALFGRIQKKLHHNLLPDIEIKTVENRVVMLHPTDIHYLEYKTGHHISVVTNSQAYEYIGKIDDAEKEYSSMGFIRTHRAFIVNMAYIWVIESDNVTLTNGDKVPVSRRYSQTLKERYRSYRRDNSHA